MAMVLSASLFQMVHSYTAFAHEGQIVPVDHAQEQRSLVVGHRVFSAQTAAVHPQDACKWQQVRAAPARRRKRSGYSVGGKSGTAHKQVGKGYASNKYRSWFTGMAPIDKPRIVPWV